jgi:hypothetical protein
MPDVYVEVGAAKSVPPKYLAAAQAEMKAAIIAAVNKTGSGMTTVKPPRGQGIQVNVLVFKLTQDGANVTCSAIADLFELPSKQRFTIASGSPRGQGKVAGQLDAVAGACVGAAVADLMVNIGPGIAGAQTAPASTGTAASKSPLIFIAPFQVNYTKDPNAAPAGMSAKAIADITTMMTNKIKANPLRFTQNPSAFKAGSGMPAYAIGIKVESVVFDADAKQMVAKTQGYVAEHPSNSMKVLSLPGKATQPQMMKPPRDEDKVRLLVDAAEAATDNAINWILKTHP